MLWAGAPPVWNISSGFERNAEPVVKKVIIIVVGLIVLLGAAGGGLFFMGMLDEPLGLNKQVVKDGAEGDASGEGSAAEQVAEALFVQFEPISAPVIAKGRVEYLVLLTLSLQVADIGAKNDVNAVLPRLRDAMHTELFTMPILRDEETGAIDLTDLKKRVLTLTRNMVQSDGIEDVLILKIMRMGG
jgi:flagellar basal body-associated protein FliL